MLSQGENESFIDEDKAYRAEQKVFNCKHRKHTKKDYQKQNLKQESIHSSLLVTDV